MKYTDINIMDEIVTTMLNGHWSEAQTEYKACNFSAQDFGNWMQYQENDVLQDVALLGFYTRDYTPNEKGEY